MPLFVPNGNATNPAPGPLYPNVLPSATGTLPNPVFFQKDFQMPMIHEADVVLEHEIMRDTVLSVSWLFSKGQNLIDFIDTNLNPPTATENIKYVGGPLDGQTIPMKVYTGARPNPAFGVLLQMSSRVDSNYNAGVVQLNRRFSHGLQFRNTYTFSHALDNGQASTTFTPGSGYNHFDAFNLGLDKGNSNFDVRHRFVSSIVWAPEVKLGNRVVQTVLQGWSMSPIFTATAGNSTNASVSGSNPFTTASLGGVSTPAGGINGSFGTLRVPALPRNFLQQPSTYVLDMRMSRRFRIREGQALEVLAEAFNLTNHVNITSVQTTMYTFSGTAAAPVLTFNPAAGTPFQTGSRNNSGANGPFHERQVQFAARFHF
jgi:hypothetical protein